MGLFHSNYDKPGPGIEKDTPGKKGFPRWWEVFTRDNGALLQSNLYVLICALPTLASTLLFATSAQSGTPILLCLLANILFAIPLGPALAAMHRLTLQMARDVPFFTWAEFKKSYKTNFKQGAITMVLLAILGDAILWNLYLLGVTTGYTVLTLVALLLSIYIWFSMMNYTFQQIAMMELPLHTIYKNSMLLVLVAGWRGFVGVVLDIAIVVCMMLYTYVAMPLVLFGFFAIIIMTTDLIFWPRFEQLFITRDIAPRGRHRSASKEWQDLADEDNAAGSDGESDASDAEENASSDETDK